MLSKDQKKLMELIEAKLSATDIAKQLGITNLQLYKRITNLENKGLVLTRKYFSDGNIMYSVDNSQINYESGIITKPSEKEMDILVVSDPHLGTKKEGLKELDRAYNYAANKGIHIVFNCGDFIEGTFGQNATKFKDPMKQVDYLIKKYPHDDSILTFGVLGNHDESLFNSYKVDLKEILRNYRHDIIVNGSQSSNITIKNDEICLFHRINKYFSEIKNNASLVLNGHFHEAKFYPFGSVEGKTIINVPALCSFGDSMPSAIRLTIKFKGDMIKRVEAHQVLFLDKDYEINEICYDFPTRKAEKVRGLVCDYGKEEIASQEVEEKPVEKEQNSTKRKDKRTSTLLKESKVEKMISAEADTTLEERKQILLDLYQTEPKKNTSRKKKTTIPKSLELTTEERNAVIAPKDRDEELVDKVVAALHLGVEKTTVEKPKAKRLSQIEKFNKKYNL